jgi:flavin reductase (DIM6/NTAB) family NADH-FMN oxidoreductase RutF
MKKYDLNNIMQMDSFYRVKLINCLSGFRMPVLIGTKDEKNGENLAIFNSFTHIGSNPPLFGVIFRPDSVPRNTLANIQTTKLYTINFIPEHLIDQAHQTSAKYSPDTSEFTACGIEAEYRDGFPAPFVRESLVKIAMELAETHHIQSNGTILVVGRMLELNMSDTVISEDGFIDFEALGTPGMIGLDAYMSFKKIKRLSYAKPDTWVKEI